MNRRAKWNKRYESKSIDKLLPDHFLVENIVQFKPGSVLDIACGNGRNAIFLSGKGFEVTGIDYSEVALDQLNSYSHDNSLEIKTMELDLSLNNAFSTLEGFDNIIITRYKLSSHLLNQIPSILNYNGVFLYCTFTEKPFEQKTFPEEFYLRKGELIEMDWGLELIKYSSFKDENGYQDAYLFKKPAEPGVI